MPRRLMPPGFFRAAMVLMAVLYVLDPVVQLWLSPWRFLGLMPIGVGVWLNMAGSRLFDQAGTPIKPFDGASVFVVDGPFRYSRNPMYLGMASALVGVGILLGGASPFLVVPAFMLLIQRQFIVHEEADLAERFGEDYSEYCRRVRRWL